MVGSIAYVDTDSIEGSNTTFNHTGVGTGTAAADRHVAVVTQGTQSGVTANSVVSVTVGGNAATHLKTRLGGTDAGGNRVVTSAWIVELPSGTSENISVVWQATMFDNVVSTFELNGIDPTVVDEDEDFSSSGSPHAVDLQLDVPAGGVALASCAEFSATEEAWTGFTERNAELNFSTNRYSVADFEAAVAQEPLVGAVTFTGSPTTMAAIAVSFAAAGGDVTAPVLSNPAATETGETTADLAVDTDEGNGTLYWVISTSSSAPSGAQIAAGQDHTGSPGADSGNQAVVGTGTQNANASGLTEGTAYWAYFVQDDAAANRSNIVSDTFTTDAEAAPATPIPAAESSGGGGNRRRGRRYPYPNVIDDGWDYDEPDARAEPEPKAPAAAPKKAPEPPQAPRKPAGLVLVAKASMPPVALPEAIAEPVRAPVPTGDEWRAALEAEVEALRAEVAELKAQRRDDDEEQRLLKWLMEDSEA